MPVACSRLARGKQGGAHRVVGITRIIGVVLGLFLALSGQADAQTTSSIIMSKTMTDTSGNPITVVQPGQTINYTIRFRNPGPAPVPAPTTITDTMTNATEVLGSMKPLPLNFTSVNNPTNNPGVSDFAGSTAQFTTNQPLFPNGAVGFTAVSTAAGTPFNAQSAAGDGLNPIVVPEDPTAAAGSLNAVPRIYWVNHVSNIPGGGSANSAALFGCKDFSGNWCPGFPKYLGVGNTPADATGFNPAWDSSSLAAFPTLWQSIGTFTKSRMLKVKTATGWRLYVLGVDAYRQNSSPTGASGNPISGWGNPGNNPHFGGAYWPEITAPGCQQPQDYDQSSGGGGGGGGGGGTGCPLQTMHPNWTNLALFCWDTSTMDACPNILVAGGTSFLSTNPNHPFSSGEIEYNSQVGGYFTSPGSSAVWQSGNLAYVAVQRYNSTSGQRYNTIFKCDLVAGTCASLWDDFALAPYDKGANLGVDGLACTGACGPRMFTNVDVFATANQVCALYTKEDFNYDSNNGYSDANQTGGSSICVNASTGAQISANFFPYGTLPWQTDSFVPLLDSSGNTTGECYSAAFTNQTMLCYGHYPVGTGATTFGTPPAVANPFPSTITNLFSFTPLSSSFTNDSGTPTTTQVYYSQNGFRAGATVLDSKTYCYDYALQAPCPTFADVVSTLSSGVHDWNVGDRFGNGAVWPSGALQFPYGNNYHYAYYAGCFVGMGDHSLIWFFDPRTGSSPCVPTSATQQVELNSSYCDGKNHVSAWNQLNITPPSPDKTTSLYLSFADPATPNTPFLTTGNLLVTQGQTITVPIGTPGPYYIDYAAHPKLVITINAAQSTLVSNATYQISVSGNTDEPDQQICYQAVAPSVCPSPLAVTNQATISGNGSSASSNLTSGVCGANMMIGIAKTNNPATTYVPGSQIVYTVVVNNAGNIPADGTAVSDPLPAGIASQTWTCAGSGGATCAGSGSGAINDTLLALPVGAKATYTITATTTTTGLNPLTNTASATPPTGGTCAPDKHAPPCTATVANTPVPQISIVKQVTESRATPAGTLHYTVIVTNTGAVSANGTTVSDALPSGVTSQSWTCAGAGGATCTASGSGAISDTISTFPVGSKVTYSMTATLATSLPANVVNTATANPPSGGTCTPGNTAAPCTTTVTTPTVPVVSIAKQVTETQAKPNGTLHYTVKVTNTSTVAANGTTVSDPIPSGIASQTWTCAGSGGATCAASGSGAISDTIATFPAGTSVTYSITATVSSSPPANVVNTATTTPPPGGLCSPGNTAPPCSTTVTTPSTPVVGITKSVQETLAKPSGTLHYTVVVTNTGSVPADGTTVSDPLPAGVASATWTCAGTGGATCAASGIGAISDTIAAFPVGAKATYSVIATLVASPSASIVNTATTTPPAGGTCSPGNTAPPCSSTVTTPLAPVVSIVKTVQESVAKPAGTLHYTVVVTNAGSVNANGTTVSDPLPAGVASSTWTCAGAGGATCTASGSGAISDTIATFPVGASATYSITATIAANPPANVVNTATATPPPGGLCSPGNTAAPCTTTVTTPTVPVVSIAKQVTETLAKPNGTLHYTVVVTNAGSVPADGTTVSDPLPAGVSSATWTCAGTGGATCAASGTDAISDVITAFPVGAKATYSITATLNSTLPASVVNTATTTPPTGGLCSPGNSAPPCSTTVNTPTAPLISIAKSVQETIATPTGTLHYTVVVTNAGVVSANGTTVSDPLPTGIASATWTCAGAGGATCASSGTGAISDTLATFPVGASATYSITATVAANPPASIVNTATTTPPSGGACSPGNTAPPCTTTVTTPLAPEVSIKKTVQEKFWTPGGTLHYSIVVSNVGVVTANGTTVSDALPAGVVSASWTCAGTGGATCAASGTGAISDTIGTFPVGSSVTYAVVATTDTQIESQNIINTASTTPPTGGTCAPGNTAPPCTTTVTTPLLPIVWIQKSVQESLAIPGGALHYTVTVTNAGPTAADGTTVSDPLPVGIASATWTCTGSGGATCAANGTGAISDTIGTFPQGSKVVYSIAGTVGAAPPANVVNIASTTPPSGGECSDSMVTIPGTATLTAPPCTAQVTTPTAPIIRITKTNNPSGILSAGGQVTYTVTVSNAGSVPADGTSVSDPVPAGIAAQTWTCSGQGGATCTASGSGAISDTLNALPVGGQAVYTVVATVTATPPASIINSATATPPPNGLCAPGNTAPPCSTTVTNTTAPVIGITKSVTETQSVPGGTLHYTVVVTNAGNVAADGTKLVDPLPTGIASATWSCVGAGGAICTVSGTGAINDTLFTFPVGSHVTYSIVATVAGNAPDTITNTATATPPASGMCAPGNTAPPCIASVSTGSVPVIGIAKSVKETLATPGGTLHYTVIVTNTGTVKADGTTVSDPLPAGIASATWTCAGASGATCAASGTGAINDTLFTFPVGSSVTYSVTATVGATPPTSIVNTATTTPPNGGVCAPNNAAPPCSTTVTTPTAPVIGITKSIKETQYKPGDTLHWTVVVTNTGNVLANGSTVSDAIPAGIASQTWTCVGANGATCAASGTGAIADTLATFPVGSSVTYSIASIVNATPPATIINTANANPPSGGACSPGNTAPPCVASASTGSVPIVSIVKSVKETLATPGGTLHYTVTVSNVGPTPADGTTVSDPIPAGITAQTWTCTGSGGATCAASGTGAIADTLAAFPVGSSVAYSITASVAATPPATIVNTATTTPPNGGACSPGNTAPPCTTTVTTPTAPIVGITKSVQETTFKPGDTIHWTVVVTNAGSVSANGTTVSDALPSGIASQSWTCTGTGGATCAASGTGAIADTLAAFPVGAKATYSLATVVAQTPPENILNTATASPPAGGTCSPGNTAPPCVASASTGAVPLISIVKKTQETFAQPGHLVHYTVTVSNLSATKADGTAVSDPLPAGIASATWTCVGAGGATCATSGSGAIADTIGTFPAGASVTYSITATVSLSPPVSIVNTATALPPPASLCVPGNTPPPCSTTVTTPTTPIIGIAKSVKETHVTAGGDVHWTVVVTNTGSVPADGTTVSDAIPAGLTNQTWTCVGANGATCAASGSDAIADTLATFPVGSSVTYSITDKVPNPLKSEGNVVNTASAIPPVNGVCSPDGSAPPCVATATVDPSNIPPVPAPTLSLTALWLLMLSMAGFALVALRRS